MFHRHALVFAAITAALILALPLYAGEKAGQGTGTGDNASNIPRTNTGEKKKPTKPPTGPPVCDPDGMGQITPLIEFNLKEGRMPTYSGGVIKAEVLGHGLCKGTRFTVNLSLEGEAVDGQPFEFKSDELVEKIELKFEGGRTFFAGDYELRVVFEPERQSRKIEEKLRKSLGVKCTKSVGCASVYLGDKEDEEKERDMLTKHYREAMKKAEELREEFLKKYHDTFEKTTGKFDNGSEIPSAKKIPFRQTEWRQFITAWRDNLRRVNEKRESLKKRYVAMLWPNCDKRLSEMIGSLMYLSKVASIKLYKSQPAQPDGKKIEPDPDDLIAEQDVPSDPGSHLRSFENNKKAVEDWITSRERSKQVEKEAEKKKKELEKEEREAKKKGK